MRFRIIKWQWIHPTSNECLLDWRAFIILSWWHRSILFSVIWTMHFWERFELKLHSVPSLLESASLDFYFLSPLLPKCFLEVVFPLISCSLHVSSSFFCCCFVLSFLSTAEGSWFVFHFLFVIQAFPSSLCFCFLVLLCGLGSCWKLSWAIVLQPEPWGMFCWAPAPCSLQISSDAFIEEEGKQKHSKERLFSSFIHQYAFELPCL